MTAPFTPTSSVSALAICPDDSVFVGFQGNVYNMFRKLSSAGAIVPGFGANGLGFTWVEWGDTSSLGGITCQTDGSMRTVGRWTGATSGLGIGQIRANGTWDPAFAAGVGNTKFPDASVLGAWSGIVKTSSDQTAAVFWNDTKKVSEIAMFARGGALMDATFSTDGRAQTSLYTRHVALQSDGRILVAGSRGIARFKPTGEVDTSFGTNGAIALTNSDERLNVRVAVQSDGRIVFATFNGAFSIRRFWD